MSDVQADTPAVDPLAADKAALADAQAKLAQDQANHDAAQAALDVATEQHAQAHLALDADAQALAAAQAKLASDQAEFEAAVAAHNDTVAAAAAATAVPDGVAVATDEVHAHLDGIEAIAIKWGGDIGTELRNIVGHLKSLFESKPAA